MNIFLRFFLITSLIFGVNACSKDSKSPTENNNNSHTIEKSKKRGLAYNLTQPADLDTLKNGVSWWYNWYFNTSAPEGYYEDYQLEFIPMLWGGNNAVDFASVKLFILNHSEIKYLLLLNEPNLTDQANHTPQQAAAIWINYEGLIDDLAAEGRAVSLVGPAMTWGTLAGYSDPVVWLDAFYEAYRTANDSKDPRIDYLAFHWYDYGLDAQLDRLEKYGKQIWITEMANWNSQINSYEKQKQQMMLMVSICENRDDVFRYAWFTGRGAENHFSNLFDSEPGKLNELGQLYISLPYSE